LGFCSREKIENGEMECPEQTRVSLSSNTEEHTSLVPFGLAIESFPSRAQFDISKDTAQSNLLKSDTSLLMQLSLTKSILRRISCIIWRTNNSVLVLSNQKKHTVHWLREHDQRTNGPQVTSLLPAKSSSKSRMPLKLTISYSNRYAAG